MKVRITKSPDGKGKFVSKLQKFTAQMGGVPQQSSQQQLINFIANDIASGKPKEETIIRLLPILKQDFNAANLYYDQVYQMYASKETEDEEEETDEEIENNKVQIANNPVMQPVSEQNETKISNDLIAEDRDDSDFDEEIYSDYEDPNAATETQAKLGGNFKKERRKYVNNVLKLAKKKLGGTGEFTQSSTPDPTGEEVRNNMKGSFVNTLKNNAQLAVIKEQAENQFDSYMQDGGQEQPYDFTHYTHGDTDVFHDPMNELVQARLGFNKRRGFRNTPYYMSPFMGLTPDMLQMGMMGPISKLDVTRSHWLTGKPSRYSMEFSPMPGMGMGYYLPGYGYGMKTTGRKTPGRIVTEQISKEVNNNAINEVANTTNSEAASNAAVGPKNWNEADYNNDRIPDYLQPDGAGTENLAMGRNLPVGPSENPNDPTEKIPTEKVITKPKKKTTAPKTVTPKVTPGVTPPTDPFGIVAGIGNLIREGADYLDQGITKGRDWLEKTAKGNIDLGYNAWRSDPENPLTDAASTREEFLKRYPSGYYPGQTYGKREDLNIKPVTGLDENDYLTYLFPGAFRYTIPGAIPEATKLLGSGSRAAQRGANNIYKEFWKSVKNNPKSLDEYFRNPKMQQEANKFFKDYWKSTNRKGLPEPPSGTQLKFSFPNKQVGGIVNDPFIDPYGNLQKFIYGGNDDFTQADLDYTYSKDTSDPYFQDGGLTKYQYRGEVNENNYICPPGMRGCFPSEEQRKANQETYDRIYGKNPPNTQYGTYDNYAKQIGDRLGMSLRDDLSAKEMYELAQKAGMNNTRTQTNTNRNVNPNYFNAGYNRQAFPGVYYDPRLGRRGPGIFPGRVASYAGTWAKPMGMYIPGTNQPYTGMFDPTGISRINVTKSGWLTGAPKRYTIDYNVNRDASGKPMINLPTYGSLTSTGSTAAGSNVPKGSDLESTLQRETQGLSGRDLRVKERDIKRAFKQGYGSDYAYDDSRNGAFTSTPTTSTTTPTTAGTGEDKEYIAEFQQKQKDRGLVWNEQQQKWVPNAQNMEAINTATDPNYLNNQKAAGNAMQQMFSNASNLSDYSSSPRQSSAPDVRQQTGPTTALDYLQGKVKPTSRTQNGTTIINAAGEPITDQNFIEANAPSNPLAAFIQSALGPNKQNELVSKNPGFNLPINTPSPKPEFGIDNDRQYIDLPGDYDNVSDIYDNVPDIYGSQKDMYMNLQNMRNQAYPEWRRNNKSFGQDQRERQSNFAFGGYYQPGGEKRRIMPQVYDRLDKLRSFFNNDADENSLPVPQQTVQEDIPLVDFYNQSSEDANYFLENFQNTLPIPEEEVVYQTEYTPEELGLNKKITKNINSKKTIKKKSNTSSSQKKSNTSSSVPVDSYQKYITENKNNFKPMSPEELAKAQKAKYEKDVARYSSRNYNSYKDAKNAARTFSDVATTDDLILRMGNEIDSLREKEMALLNKPNKTAAEKKQFAEINKKANDLVIKKQAEEAKLKKRVDNLLAGKKRFGGIPMAQYGFQTPVTEDDRTKPALDRMQTMSSQDAGRQLLNSQLDAMREEYGEKPGIVSVDYKNKNMWEVDFPDIINKRINPALALATGLKDRADTKQIQNQLYNEFYGDAYAPERARIDRGNYDTNSGLFKPDQEGFEGVVRYGGSIYQDGGSIFEDIDEGDEVMMTPEELQEFLANGGEVEYI